MTDQLIGQTFERYQIQNRLGDGPLGAIYRAFDPTLQREVALQLVRLPADRPDLGEAFLSQVRLAAQLDDPGLVKVHDFGRSGGWVYVVTDYVPGATLAQLFQDLRAHNQWLPLTEAVGVAHQLALTCDYLTRQGLAPTSLDPADMLLRPDPFDGLPFRVVLASFGLEPSRLGASGDWPARASARTPAYAYWSPEQARGEPVDARGTVYSLGALLYELAVGWQPFPAETPADAVRQHAQPAPPPRARRADLPETVEAVLLRALAPNPADRYPDPAALADALAGLLPDVQRVDLQPGAAAWNVSLLAPYQRSLGAVTASSPALTPAGQEARPAAERRAFFRFDGNLVDANLVQTSVDGHVGVYVEVPQFTVTPGEPTSTGLFLVNLGSELDHFSVAVGGLPSGWLAAPLPPTSVPLIPGDSRRVTITLAPPRSPAGRAGHYNVTVRVTSQSHPDQSVEARLSVTVAAFSQFQSELSAATLQAGEPARVTVHNQGNTPEAYVINFDDPDGKLAFDPPFLNLAVPEGQVGAADFVAHRRQTRLAGDHRVYPFWIRVAASAGPEQKLTAEVITHALIPVWLLLAAVFGCCVLAGASALAYNGLQASGARTATAAFQQTGGAIAQQTISAVATQVAVNGLLTPTLTLTPTATATGTITPLTPTSTGTPLPPSTTPLPATATLTPAPATPSSTPAPATDTLTPVPPSATLAPPTLTSTPTPTAAPATATLTLAPPASPTPAPSAAGRLLFTSARSGQPNIYLVNGDGSGEAPLTTNGANQNPRWSAAAQRLVFESTRDGHSEIYSMALDGTGQTRLTNNAAGNTAPAWSPDGAHIVFVSARDGNPQIYSMSPDGSNQTRLTHDSAADTAPAWAPDGSRLAFISDRDGQPEVYVMSPDGSNQTRLTNDTVAESDLAWAPNSVWLAYVRDAGANADIYLAPATGSAALRLTNNSAADTQPAWTPNSARLAFVSERDGNAEIYTMLADGSGPTRLTNSAGRDEHPLWSPAGDRLAFTSDRDGSPQVYVMNGDGTAQTRLTNDGSTDVLVAWLP